MAYLCGDRDVRPTSRSTSPATAIPWPPRRAGFGSTTSDPFNIAGLVQAREPDVDCTGSLTEGDTGATVNALADPSSPVLTMSLTPGGIDCADYEGAVGPR